MKFAQRENIPSRATIYLLETMRRKRARRRKNVYEGGREHVSVCTGRGGEVDGERGTESVYSSGVC